MSQPEFDEPQPRPSERDDYEAPALVVLGTVRELTEGFLGPAIGTGANGITSILSDRALKENFEDVEVQEVLTRALSIPVQSWNYTADEAGVRHVGAMAQDFAAAFGLGADERSIATVDAVGVCMASIQALATQLRKQQAENRALRADLDELRQRLAVTA